MTWTIDAIADVSVNEGVAYTSVTPSLSGDTPIGSVTYTLSGTDAADFTIDPSTGVVSMIARDFENPEDVDTSNTYDLTITATDGDSNSDAEDWVVSVSNDVTGPGATITASEVNDGDVSDHSSISLIFTLSETSSDFFVDDVAVTNGTLSEFIVIIGSVYKRYTATFTPTEEGPTSIKVASDKFTDLENNNNTTSNEFNWTYLALMPDPTLKKDVVGSVEAWSNMASRWGYRNIDAVHDRLRWLDRNKDSTKTSHQGIKLRFKNRVVDKIMNDTPKSIDPVLDNVQSSVVGSLGCISHFINRSSQADTSSPKTGSTSNDLRPNSYTVKKGDNLYRIGLEHGYDHREIAAANNIDAPYSVRVGQKLNFSSLNTKESIDDVKPSTYESEGGIIDYSVGAEEVAQANLLRPNSYTVKKGDNLYRIGLEHGYDHREIAAANNIDAPYSVRVGQKLNFSSLNTKESIDDVKPSTYESEGGIIDYSVGAEEVAQANLQKGDNPCDEGRHGGASVDLDGVKNIVTSEFQNTVINEAAILREDVIGTLNPAFGPVIGDWAVWTSGEIMFGKSNATSVASQQDTNYQSIHLGFDRPLEDGDGTIGVALGIGIDKTDIGSDITNVKANNYSALVYGEFDQDVGTTLEATLGVGHLKFDTIRKDGLDTLTGSRAADQIFGSLTLRGDNIEILRDPSIDTSTLEQKYFKSGYGRISPYGKVDIVLTKFKKFSEIGAVTALTFEEQTMRNARAAVGVDIDYLFKEGGITIRPFSKLEYGVDISKSSDVALYYTVEGEGVPYSLQLKNSSDQLWKFGLGVELYTEDNLNAVINYKRQNGIGPNSRPVESVYFDLIWNFI